MQLTPQTTVFRLIEEYPFLESYLKRFGGTEGMYVGQEARRKAGRMITIRHLAVISATPLPRILAELQAEILRVTGEAAELGSVAAPKFDARRTEEFAEIVRELYEGGDLDQLKGRFGTLMESVHGSEFARLGWELPDDDTAQMKIERLYEQHAYMFSARDGAEVAAPAGHPLHTFQAELHALGVAAATLRTTLERLGARPSPRAWEALGSTFDGAFGRVCEVERHLRRVEDLVLPLLEGRQGAGPARLLEGPFGRLRRSIEQARVAARAGRRRPLLAACGNLVAALDDVLYKEECILLPLAMEKVTAADWRAVRATEAAYGWAIIAEPLPWPRPGGALRDRPDELDDGGTMTSLTLETGTLTAEQVSLVLMNLPFELTYADEQDRVRFFSGGDRFFSRKPSIIGRPVQECHTAAGLGTVQRLIDAFRAHEQDEAEFWFDSDGRFLHVLFRAVRDRGGVYRGVLEVCRDATDLRAVPARGLFDTPRASARVRAVTPITDGIRAGDGEIVLDSGTLTVPELDNMLRAVPADFSFGDERDVLLHFSEGGIYKDCDRDTIGGTMQACHPSGAQAALKRVLDEFRAGRSDAFEAIEQEADAWTFLRYTPVRTADGAYRGILECHQDITRLRHLEGERHDLSW